MEYLMRAGEGLGQALLSFAVYRFGTKRARFRSAVTLGFLVAAAGAITLGPSQTSLSAEGFFWGGLFFGNARDRSSDPRQAASNEEGGAKVRRITVAGHRHARAHTPLVARQAICVRLCDGFSFPIGAYAGSRGLGRQASMCQSDCPDAATALYVLPKGSDKIEEAVSARGNRHYSELPDAFHYKALLDDACTCHKASSAGPTMSLLRDLTLRRGDAVMTSSGLQVYHGGESFPHRRSDFVALAQSPDVVRSQRSAFRDIERASHKPHAYAPPSAEALFSDPAAPLPTRLNKQASRN
jgi:hypothetical protein